MDEIHDQVRIQPGPEKLVDLEKVEVGGTIGKRGYLCRGETLNDNEGRLRRQELVNDHPIINRIVINWDRFRLLVNLRSPSRTCAENQDQHRDALQKATHPLPLVQCHAMQDSRARLRGSTTHKYQPTCLFAMRRKAA